MAVAHLEVTRRSSFPFDYERIDGKLHFVVDPSHAANGRIVDLDKAPRDEGGRVRFWADFVLLQPADAARANRRLLYFVVNRGLRVGVPFNRFAPRLPTLPPTDDIDVGDGFLMKRGWTVAMCGWQWDVQRQPGLMGLEAPQALDADGTPIQGRVAVAFQPNEHHAYHLLSHWPLHPPPGRQDFTYGHGRSQCGRFLRQFLYEGLNRDEDGRQVFDGLIPDVAGARRGEFNQRHGQPSETSPLGFGGLFPFASDDLTDPATGRTDGLLRRQRQLGGVPRIFTTNTSSEYWRVDCSLIHTDPAGTRDADPPAGERIYLIAGHQHGPDLPAIRDATDIGARGANPFNVVDGSAVERAFLINL